MTDSFIPCERTTDASELFLSDTDRPLRPGPAERARRIAVGMPIVARVAKRTARRLPSSMDVRDLMSAGTEGLLRAIDSYDAARCDRFEPYAEMRIRGAILDELRGLDVVTRHGRRRINELKRATELLSQELGRAPSEEEIAARLSISVEDVQRLIASQARGAEMGTAAVDPDAVACAVTPSPVDACIELDLRRKLAAAIEQLPARMREVLALYYQHECTQAEIGQVLGVTESRVCQILREISLRLRAALAADAEAWSAA